HVAFKGEATIVTRPSESAMSVGQPPKMPERVGGGDGGARDEVVITSALRGGGDT
ncbi:hypothetical protein KI387_023763, partial [Taxus chinensis]